MTPPPAAGRTSGTPRFFTRRDALTGLASLVALGSLPAAFAQQRTNLIELQGEALLNGVRLQPGSTIQTGDTLQTGPGARVIFTMGNAAFLVRHNTFLAVERGTTLNTVSLLRLLTGAVASVWRPGSRGTLLTATLTAGLLGSAGNGLYAEVFREQANRTYFCNCYGTVALDAGGIKRE